MKIQEVLNATGMGLTLFTGQQSRVGIGVSGAWTGTVSFLGSPDGVRFDPVAMTPFASGASSYSRCLART